jgi:hypothetical protein
MYTAALLLSDESSSGARTLACSQLSKGDDANEQVGNGE